MKRAREKEEETQTELCESKYALWFDFSFLSLFSFFFCIRAPVAFWLTQNKASFGSDLIFMHLQVMKTRKYSLQLQKHARSCAKTLLVSVWSLRLSRIQLFPCVSHFSIEEAVEAEGRVSPPGERGTGYQKESPKVLKSDLCSRKQKQKKAKWGCCRQEYLQTPTRREWDQILLWRYTVNYVHTLHASTRGTSPISPAKRRDLYRLASASRRSHTGAAKRGHRCPKASRFSVSQFSRESSSFHFLIKNVILREQSFIISWIIYSVV